RPDAGHGGATFQPQPGQYSGSQSSDCRQQAARRPAAAHRAKRGASSLPIGGPQRRAVPKYRPRHRAFRPPHGRHRAELCQ
nr:hypothetical protein [Tanacetum cinerariifolium]